MSANDKNNEIPSQSAGSLAYAQVMLVDLDLIDVEKKGTRSGGAYPLEHLNRITQTAIALGGLLQPIGLQEIRDGDTVRYTLVFGAARLAAYQRNRSYMEGAPGANGASASSPLPTHRAEYLVQVEMLNAKTGKAEFQTLDDNEKEKFLSENIEGRDDFSQTVPALCGMEAIDWSRIPAVILPNITVPTYRRTASLVENFVRQEMHPLLLSDLLTELKAEYEVENVGARNGATGGGRNGVGTRSKTDFSESEKPVESFATFYARLLHVRPGKIYDLLRLQRLSLENRKKFSDGKLTLTSALEKADMAELNAKSGVTAFQEPKTEEALGGDKKYNDAFKMHQAEVYDFPDSKVEDVHEQKTLQAIDRLSQEAQELRKMFYSRELSKVKEETKTLFVQIVYQLLVEAEQLIGLKHYRALLSREKIKAAKKETGRATRKISRKSKKNKKVKVPKNPNTVRKFILPRYQGQAQSMPLQSGQ